MFIPLYCVTLFEINIGRAIFFFSYTNKMILIAFLSPLFYSIWSNVHCHLCGLLCVFLCPIQLTFIPRVSEQSCSLLLLVYNANASLLIERLMHNLHLLKSWKFWICKLLLIWTFRWWELFSVLNVFLIFRSFIVFSNGGVLIDICPTPIAGYAFICKFSGLVVLQLEVCNKNI